MAKIEMDISEYEEIKEHKVTLQKSLEKQEELQQRIEQLQKEKIEALESNSKKVTIVEETRVDEVALVSRDIYDIIKIIQNPDALFQIRKFHGDLDNLNDMVEACFTKQKVKSEPVKTVTTQGLDEVKKAIRKDLESEITQEHLENIKTIKVLRERIESIIGNQEPLKKEILELQLEIGSLQKDIDQLHKDNTELEDWDELREGQIKGLLNEKVSFFGAAKRLKELKQVINESRE